LNALADPNAARGVSSKNAKLQGDILPKQFLGRNALHPTSEKTKKIDNHGTQSIRGYEPSPRDDAFRPPQKYTICSPSPKPCFMCRKKQNKKKKKKKRRRVIFDRNSSDTRNKNVNLRRLGPSATVC
jgi:hypothetical protein